MIFLLISYEKEGIWSTITLKEKNQKAEDVLMSLKLQLNNIRILCRVQKNREYLANKYLESSLNTKNFGQPWMDPDEDLTEVEPQEIKQ